MAGDWIKMRSDLSDDPAVISMAAALGMDEFAVIGRLQALWSWADRQSRDGHAPGVTAAWVDRKVQRDGFSAAMVSVKWLLIDEAGITFPKFDSHNGETAKTRALGTKRKQNERSRDKGHAAVSLESHEMSRTERDKSETREEKRREEKNPLTPAGGEYVPDGFVAFWDAWPKNHRKGAKEKCLEHWRKSRLEGQASTILAHVRAMASTVDWTKENRQFVPAPIVYLRSGAWSGADIGLPTGMFDGAI